MGLTPNIFKYLLAVSLPLAVGLSLLSRPLIGVLYGPSYAPAIEPLVILAWTIPLIFLAEFLRYSSFVLGQEKLAAGVVATAVVCNVLLNLIFIPVYGMMAAAAATVFTEALLVGLYLFQARRLLPLSALGRAVWRPLLAGLMMLVSLLLTRPLPPLVSLMIALSGYGGGLLLAGFVGADEKFFIGKLKERLFSGRV